MSMSGDRKSQHAGEMAAQLALSLDNLESVLGQGGMSLANLVLVVELEGTAVA
jgi:hypothetical protein